MSMYTIIEDLVMEWRAEQRKRDEPMKTRTVIQRTHPREIELVHVEQTCANCGKEMELWTLPGTWTPSTCTAECRIERTRELTRIRQARFRERRKKDQVE